MGRASTSRFFWKISIFIALYVIVGCRPSSTSGRLGPEEEPIPESVNFDLNRIKARGYLVAIMQNSSTGLFLYKGKTMGYEYELLERFAKSQGVELRINVTSSLSEGFEKLHKGEGDILAYNLTVTKDRKRKIAFTDYHNLVRMVLVQRKPDNWRDMKLHEIEKALIRNPIDLIGKEIYIRHHSAYQERLENLSEEIGGDIVIVEDFPEVETEMLIKKVADGKIDYTVAEEDVALVNATYYPNLDVETPISFPQQIAWGVRKNAPELLQSLNHWIAEMKRTTDYYVIYDKYFKSRKQALQRTKSEFFSLRGSQISPYDDLIKIYSTELGWDWRLLSALIYQESQFDKDAQSWVGAVGLMQLLPATAEEYGVTNLTNPSRNLYAGTMHLKWLAKFWEDKIQDPEERLKFILASYNVGHGHVMDAVKLTEKYRKDPQLWDDNVEDFLARKSSPKYFKDPVVEFGYCKGSEPVAYVEEIYKIYENYKALYPDATKSTALKF